MVNMVHTYLKTPIHGDLEHFTYLSIAAFICWQRKFDFMDPTGFAYKYRCPGIPDIYVKYRRKVKDKFGTRPYDQYAVIEVETHANKEDTDKKISQFESAAMNVQLIIIPMNKFEKWKNNEIANGVEHSSDFQWVYEYMKLFIPEQE